MFPVALICLFALQSTHASYLFPSSWRNTPYVTNSTKTEGIKTHGTPEAKMYFESFSLNKLNPAYWFYDTTEDDKVEELYNLVRCMIEDDHSLCKKKLQSARRLFEKKKKGEKKGSTATHDNNSVDHNVGSDSHNQTKPTDKKPLPKNTTTNPPTDKKPLPKKTTTNSPTDKKPFPNKTTTNPPEVSDKFQSESSTAGPLQKKTTEITTLTEDTATSTISAIES